MKRNEQVQHRTDNYIAFNSNTNDRSKITISTITIKLHPNDIIIIINREIIIIAEQVNE
jgi:hypothetical protein